MLGNTSANNGNLRNNDDAKERAFYNKVLNIAISNDRETISETWATGEGIYLALRRCLGSSVHIIHPNSCTTATPASSNELNATAGAKLYAKKISGFSSKGKRSLESNILNDDGSELKRPIVMILNTVSAKVRSEQDTKATAGQHWRCCVILPKNYKLPYTESSLNNANEIIFYLDSVSPQGMAKAFETALRKGCKDLFSSGEENYIHDIPAAFPNAIIRDNIEICPQAGGSDCGWWAVYNALMIVFTGDTKYLEQFKSLKSGDRGPALKLRTLLPELTIGANQQHEKSIFDVRDVDDQQAIKNSPSSRNKTTKSSVSKENLNSCSVSFSKSKGREKPQLPRVPKFSKYYPDDLMYGVLAAHCADETGSSAGNSEVKEGNRVKFGKDNILNNYLIENNGLDLNDYAKGWQVIKAIDSSQTGYLGIIYFNSISRQLVLAHRSTNFALAFTKKSSNKQSGMQTDIQGVMQGKITLHQGYGHIATEEAIKLVRTAKYSDCSLSTTGHSLGAWLAQLSTFDAAEDFGYNLKCVSFDGPGAREMIEKLAQQSVHSNFKLTDLDVTSYLSAPNIVNCAHEHFGEVYRLLPTIPQMESAIEESVETFAKLCDEAKKFVKNTANRLIKVVPKYTESEGLENKEKALRALIGHDLKYIIPYFNPSTGRPDKYNKVRKWPSITYETFGEDGKETMSFGSLFEIFNLLKKTNKYQYWLAHNGLDEDNQYVEKLENAQDRMKKFKLSYMGSYEVQEVQLYKTPVKDNINKQLVYIKNEILPRVEALSIPLGLLEKLKELTEKYKVQAHPEKISKYILVKKEHIYSITIVDLREMMREITHHYKDSYKTLHKETEALIIAAKKSGTVIIASSLPEETTKHYIKPEGVFETIDDILTYNRRAIITAFAGTGKTICALQYGYRQHLNGTIVRWFKSDTKEKLDKSYRNFGEKLGVKIVGLTQKEIIDSVNGKLQQCSQKLLLIFDNVEKKTNTGERNYLQEYLINLPIQIECLITTRNAEILSLSKESIVKLEPFNKKEATKYIKAIFKKRITGEQVETLVGELNLLPLRLSVTVKLFEQNRLPKAITNEEIEKFITSYKKSNNVIDLMIKSTGMEKRIKVWAWELLQYVAYLDPDFINVEIIEALVECGEEVLMSCIDELSRLSVLTKVEVNGFEGFRIHHLIQEDIKDCRERKVKIEDYIDQIKDDPKKLEADIIRNIVQPKAEKLTDFEVKVIILEKLNELMPILTDKPTEDWKLAVRLLPSIILVMNEVKKTIHTTTIIQAELYAKIAKHYQYVTCSFEESLSCYLQALEAYQIFHQGDHTSIANLLSSVGHAYEKKGDFVNGLDYLKRALKMNRILYQESQHQLGSATIANSLNDTGRVYVGKGELNKGLGFLEQALFMRQALYKSNHRDIAISLNNIGKAHKIKGRLGDALQHQESALEILKRLFKTDHHDIATLLNDVGLTYAEKGELDKSLSCLEQALAMRQALYQSKNHPDIAISLNNLGSIYRIRGEINKSLDFLEQALAIQYILYKGNHPCIANTLDNIGLVYHMKKEFDKSLSFFNQCLSMQQAIYEGNHLEIANSLSNIGLAYKAKREHDKSLSFFEQSLEMYKIIYKSNHPNVATLLSNIGEIYKIEGELDKGLKYQKQALTIRQTFYQGNHPDVTRLLNNIKNSQKTIFAIKAQIQNNVLNPIRSLSKKGIWNSDLISPWAIFGDWGVEGYTEEQFLIKNLGTSAQINGALQIAQMFCFEAICLGSIDCKKIDSNIAVSLGFFEIYNISTVQVKNLRCAMKFTEKYPVLIGKITDFHPEYFQDKVIMSACKHYIEYVNMKKAATKIFSEKDLPSMLDKFLLNIEERLISKVVEQEGTNANRTK